MRKLGVCKKKITIVHSNNLRKKLVINEGKKFLVRCAFIPSMQKEDCMQKP
jgi:hypothetical protein